MRQVVSRFLEMVDALLSEVSFIESEMPVYQFRIADAARAEPVTWTWDPRDGLDQGAQKSPTCVVEAESGTLDDLASGSAAPRQLLDQGKIIVGGLISDVITLATLLAAPDASGRLGDGLSTQKKKRLVAALEVRLAEITTSDEDLGRIRRMLTMWVEHRIDTITPNHWVAAAMPDLEVTPWCDPSELGLDPILARDFQELRREGSRFVEGLTRAPHYGARREDPDEPVHTKVDLRPRGWRHWNMVENFRQQPREFLAEFPTAERLIATIAQRCTVMHAGFLILEPGVSIEAHADASGWAVSYHFGLIVPPGCHITVGGERREHAEGRSLMFNDSFVHSAANESDATRVIFNVVCVNPRLTEVERTCMRAISEILPAGTLAYAK